MKNNRAQALVEYVLIIALMSILIITLIKVFGGYLRDAITKASCNLGGYEYVEGKSTGGGTCEATESINYFDEEEIEKNDDKNIKEDE